jgi:hypothetical protein
MNAGSVFLLAAGCHLAVTKSAQGETTHFQAGILPLRTLDEVTAFRHKHTMPVHWSRWVFSPTESGSIEHLTPLLGAKYFADHWDPLFGSADYEYRHWRLKEC